VNTGVDETSKALSEAVDIGIDVGMSDAVNSGIDVTCAALSDAEDIDVKVYTL